MPYIAEDETDLPELKVSAIYIAPAKGEPMVKKHSVVALAGKGLAGDRYATNVGAFSNTERVFPGNGRLITNSERQVTFISKQGFDAANAQLIAEGQQPFTEAETRRNVFVEDISPQALEALDGKKFRVGKVVFEGTMPAAPCGRPTALSEGKKPGFRTAFEGRPGLRARILNDGVITAVSTP